jgi:hypothetical protein
MDRPTLDDDTVTRVLRGSLPPDEAPRGLESVAALVRAAHGAATDDEVADPRGVVHTLSTQLHDRAAAVATATGAARRRKRLRRLVASPALVAALVATGAATAAAATGDLPRPVQSAVAGVASHAGLDVPNPGAHHRHGTHAGRTTVADGTPDGAPAGTRATTAAPTTLAPPLNGPAFAALCHAYASGNGVTRGNKADATPFRSLVDAADAAGESVETYCTNATPAPGTVLPPATTPTTTSSNPSSGTSSDEPGAPHDPQHGPPATLGNGEPHPSTATTVVHGNPHGTPPGQANGNDAKGNAGNGNGNGRGGNAAGHP